MAWSHNALGAAVPAAYCPVVGLGRAQIAPSPILFVMNARAMSCRLESSRKSHSISFGEAFDCTARGTVLARFATVLAAVFSSNGRFAEYASRLFAEHIMRR